MLEALKIGRLAADPARAVGAERPGGWGDLVYYRLHGSPVIYRSSYDDGRLASIAPKLTPATKGPRPSAFSTTRLPMPRRATRLSCGRGCKPERMSLAARKLPAGSAVMRA